MPNENLNNTSHKIVASAVVILALLLVPSPILPPHRIAEAIESSLGVS